MPVVRERETAPTGRVVKLPLINSPHAADLWRRLDAAWGRLRRAGADVEAVRVEVVLLEAQVCALPPEDLSWTTRGLALSSASLAVEADQPIFVRLPAV